VNYFITGGAGFIGSHMTERMLADGHKVTVYDNFSTGSKAFLQGAIGHPNFTLIEGDTLRLEKLAEAMYGAEVVIHFAANADVRFGLRHPHRDLEQNVIATYHVLEAMRENNVKKIVFSSTGSIYGEAQVFPTPEDAPFPVQTSLYGASKLASEGLIQAYCEGYGFQAWIFRFVSILGERYTHGHVYDFYKKLHSDPNELLVLGDGHQKKSYLHISDCIDAICLALAQAKDRVNIFNLGTPEILRGQRLGPLDLRALGVEPAADLCRGTQWVDRGQPVHLPGHQEDLCAGVAAQAEHSRGGAEDGRLPARQRMGDQMIRAVAGA
jgi:UDP-glucose 4-epimerase